ncbi:hypothetical protein [Mesorhizobium sp. RIZ17]|uniref:hypothetical protein n=1 Tax=Mesorhizobium sp. RIZ17 TaxID=3132743 RepID=UPI003DA882B6
MSGFDLRRRIGLTSVLGVGQLHGEQSAMQASWIRAGWHHPSRNCACPERLVPLDHISKIAEGTFPTQIKSVISDCEINERQRRRHSLE